MRAEEVIEAIRAHGFVHVPGPVDARAYRSLATTLGAIVGEERIALRAGAHAYVAKPGAVPFHTDHPAVEVIGWRCEQQDERDGASLLLDGRQVVATLGPEERRALATVALACPPLAGGPPTERHPVLWPTPRGVGVFCSPWLHAVEPAQQHVLDRFRARLSAAVATAAIEVRLAPWSALFVDNHRLLHGRRAIGTTSSRRLHRLWMRRGEG